MFQLLDPPLPVPEELDPEIEMDGYTIIVPFAECSETGRLVTIDVSLKRRDGEPYEGAGYMEFSETAFEISCTQDWGLGPVDSTMDREVASTWLPEGGRPLAIQILAMCLKRLIETCRPLYVLRVTNEPDLPERALVRYRSVTSEFHDWGYDLIMEGTDELGRRFWFMRRRT
jgi:hypothetical protein